MFDIIKDFFGYAVVDLAASGSRRMRIVSAVIAGPIGALIGVAWAQLDAASWIGMIGYGSVGAASGLCLGALFPTGILLLSTVLVCILIAVAGMALLGGG